MMIISTPESKKERERAVVKGFLAALGLKPKRVVRKDPPDFLVSLPDGRRLGVELVQHLHGSTVDEGEERREFESHWEALDERIRCRVRAHQRAEELRHLCVRVSLRNLVLPQKALLDALAMQLVSLASDCLDSTRRQRPVEVAEFEGRPLVEEYIRRVWFRHGGTAVFTHWYCTDTLAAVVSINDGMLLSLLHAKARRLADYRGRVGGRPVWLVIHCGLSLYVSGFPPHEHYLRSFAQRNEAALRRSGFDQVWFFPCWEGGAYLMYPPRGE